VKRILFVDDEQSVLNGLRNTLRKHRARWNMVFVLGGQAALAELAREPTDVIVSDMRMPGMDGATLLERVKDEHPGVARIILSGHAEPEAVMRATSVAHQFLNKPCDPGTLNAVVERVCNVQRLLDDPTIRGVVGKLDKLPSAPRIYWDLTRAVARSAASNQDIAAIVERDPAMCAKVLQLVNSAFFGLAQGMTSIDKAVAYLGVELLKGLALTVHVFGALEAAPVEGFSLEGLQRHSFFTAKLARRFLGVHAGADEAFTAALVHDVGKIVVAVGLPEQFAGIVHAVQRTGRPFHVVENEMIGVTHAEIGAYLLGIWGLPPTIVEAVAHHHVPGRVAHDSCAVLAAVHVADALVDESCAGARDDSPDCELDRAFLERVGLGEKLSRWRSIAEEERAELGKAG
jgi:putative nucleotidyltransferase with HDIG domain